MKRNTSTVNNSTVHAPRFVHDLWTWTRDTRYPSGRCIPVRRSVRFNPRGR